MRRVEPLVTVKLRAGCVLRRHGRAFGPGQVVRVPEHDAERLVNDHVAVYLDGRPATNLDPRTPRR